MNKKLLENLVKTSSELRAKLMWKYYNRRKVYERVKKQLAIRLALTLDIEEAIELVKEKLPGYTYPVHLDNNIRILERIRFNYAWENIDYQKASRMIKKIGIPEPYMLLAEFLLRDNGVTPY